MDLHIVDVSLATHARTTESKQTGRVGGDGRNLATTSADCRHRAAQGVSRKPECILIVFESEFELRPQIIDFFF